MKRLAFVLLLAACTAPVDSETKPLGENVLSKEQIHAAKHGPVDFLTQVKPVLEAKCVMCHNRQALPGHMSLENRSEAMRSGALGTHRELDLTEWLETFRDALKLDLRRRK